MCARLMLLTLVTALFMGAWNGDQAAIKAAVARRELRRETRLAQHKPAQTASIRTASHHPVADNATATETVVPLPPGIVPGNYRAVSQQGTVQTINVPDNDEVSSTPREFYMVDAAGGERWYLIRMQ